MLELQDISIGFGAAEPVLAKASLHLKHGQSLLVCGATGSAKTTLLNIAGGIIPRLVSSAHFSGSVLLKGRPMAELGRDDLFTTVSMVSQNVEDQLWDLGVEDIIAFPLENRAAARETVRARVALLLSELELETLRGRRVLTLSGGERRMVAIAAAMAAEPDVLVLDEPTTGLDPAARERLVRALKKLAGKVSALLVAEQDPASLREVVDSVSLLSGGALSKAVPADKIMPLEKPWREAGVLPPVRRKGTKRTSRSMGGTLLSVSRLETKLARADGQPVLSQVSFDVRAGETVALIGRNGAGKTTLFQSILGLAEITGGAITIGGEAANRWTPARRARSIAYLPQNMRRILFNMTIREEVVFAITAGAKGDRAASDEAVAMLRKYGLGAFAEENPFALSARQQALLGLACAEAASTSVAILDEPLLARDLNGRKMLDQFLDTALSAGRAIMLISHDLELVDDVASRTIILDEGAVAFDGATNKGWRSDAFRALGWAAPKAVAAGAAA